MSTTRENTPDSILTTLLEGKHVCLEQLPNMGHKYVLRHVLDCSATNLFIYFNGELVGGINGRLFDRSPISFLEVTFMSVRPRSQTWGLGRQMMTHLKAWLQAADTEHMMTCADLDAVNFFRTQGFSRHIRLDPLIWCGRIKDYEGVTLMHCEVLPSVNYATFAMRVERQRKCLLARMKPKPGFHIPRDPPAGFTASARAVSLPEDQYLELSGEDPEVLDRARELGEVVVRCFTPLMTDPRIPGFSWELNAVIERITLWPTYYRSANVFLRDVTAIIANHQVSIVDVVRDAAEVEQTITFMRLIAQILRDELDLELPTPPDPLSRMI